jgi:hypothetical protein
LPAKTLSPPGTLALQTFIALYYLRLPKKRRQAAMKVASRE